MPPTFVNASYGHQVDFDKASLRMDQDLLARARKDLLEERANAPQREIIFHAQWLWNRYCFLHIATYDTWFWPDVNPGWDLSMAELKKLIRPIPVPPEETP